MSKLIIIKIIKIIQNSIQMLNLSIWTMIRNKKLNKMKLKKIRNKIQIKIEPNKNLSKKNNYLDKLKRNNRTKMKINNLIILIKKKFKNQKSKTAIIINIMMTIKNQRVKD